MKITIAAFIEATGSERNLKVVVADSIVTFIVITGSERNLMVAVADSKIDL
jgi:hypothetical protein